MILFSSLETVVVCLQFTFCYSVVVIRYNPPSLDIFCGNRGSSSAAGVTKYKIFSSLPPYPSPLKYLPFSSFSSTFSPFPPLPFPLVLTFSSFPYPLPSHLPFNNITLFTPPAPPSLFSPFHLESSPILTKL